MANMPVDITEGPTGEQVLAVDLSVPIDRSEIEQEAPQAAVSRQLRGYGAGHTAVVRPSRGHRPSSLECGANPSPRRGRAGQQSLCSIGGAGPGPRLLHQDVGEAACGVGVGGVLEELPYRCGDALRGR
jgi:hypothetical protein